jgi:hypothetical protein
MMILACDKTNGHTPGRIQTVDFSMCPRNLLEMNQIAHVNRAYVQDLLRDRTESD